jgi:hypothetical protein
MEPLLGRTPRNPQEFWRWLAQEERVQFLSQQTELQGVKEDALFQLAWLPYREFPVSLRQAICLLQLNTTTYSKERV